MRANPVLGRNGSWLRGYGVSTGYIIRIGRFTDVVVRPLYSLPGESVVIRLLPVASTESLIGIRFLLSAKPQIRLHHVSNCLWDITFDFVFNHSLFCIGKVF